MNNGLYAEVAEFFCKEFAVGSIPTRSTMPNKVHVRQITEEVSC